MDRTASSAAERTWAVGAHLAVLANLFPIPLAGLLVSFAMFALTRPRGGFAFAHAREALNLQLTLLVLVIALVAAIAGAARAAKGETVRFPFVVRFVREPAYLH